MERLENNSLQMQSNLLKMQHELQEFKTKQGRALTLMMEKMGVNMDHFPDFIEGTSEEDEGEEDTADDPTSAPEASVPPAPEPNPDYSPEEEAADTDNDDAWNNSEGDFHICTLFYFISFFT